MIRTREWRLASLACRGDRHFTVHEFARLMGYTARFIYAQIEKGALGVERIGGSIRISSAEACRYENVEPIPIEDMWGDQRDVDMWISEWCGVYFARCHDFIKIGIAKNVVARLSTLSMSSPYDVTLIAFIQFPDGTAPADLRRVEVQLHDKFKALRVKGEWFRADTNLLDFIDQGLEGYARTYVDREPVGASIVRPSPHDLPLDKGRKPNGGPYRKVTTHPRIVSKDSPLENQSS